MIAKFATGPRKDRQWALDHDLTIIDEYDLYDDYLNECFGDVEIAGLSYTTSEAQKEVDPTAYRTGCNDYIDSIVTEGAIYELEDGTLIKEDPSDIED